MTALDDIRAERARQDAKWGEQNHPDGTGPLVQPLAGVYGVVAESSIAITLARVFTQRTNHRFSGDDDTDPRDRPGTWADILLEEVFEALAEEDVDALRRELIQVAAVASQWAEAIDRRTPPPARSRSDAPAAALGGAGGGGEP